MIFLASWKDKKVKIQKTTRQQVLKAKNVKWEILSLLVRNHVLLCTGSVAFACFGVRSNSCTFGPLHFSGFQTSSSHTFQRCFSGIRHFCRNVSRNTPTDNGGAFWGPHPACRLLLFGQSVAVWNMNLGDSSATLKFQYLKKCGCLSQDRPQSSLFGRWQHRSLKICGPTNPILFADFWCCQNASQSHWMKLFQVFVFRYPSTSLCKHWSG